MVLCVLSVATCYRANGDPVARLLSIRSDAPISTGQPSIFEVAVVAVVTALVFATVTAEVLVLLIYPELTTGPSIPDADQRLLTLIFILSWGYLLAFLVGMGVNNALSAWRQAEHP
jgi:hypothetical protein